MITIQVIFGQELVISFLGLKAHINLNKFKRTKSTKSISMTKEELKTKYSGTDCDFLYYKDGHMYYVTNDGKYILAGVPNHRTRYGDKMEFGILSKMDIFMFTLNKPGAIISNMVL